MPRPPKSEKTKKREEALQDIQQDHEQFLHVFEKPTQIYRFLRARHMISPIFMHRTLLYMNDRCSRTNARRNSFKLKDLLDFALGEENSDPHTAANKENDLCISIAGIAMNFSTEKDSTKTVAKKLKRVDVEVLLNKTIFNKRKDIDILANEITEGVVEVPVNPRVNTQTSKASNARKDACIVIPADDFSKNNIDGSSYKSISVMFRLREAASESDDSDESESEESESESESEEEEVNGRTRKRRRKASKEDEDDPAGISLKNLTTGPRKRRARAAASKKENQRKRESSKISSKSDGEDDPSSKNGKKKIYYYGSTKPSILKNNPNTSKPVLFETELLTFNSEHECLVQDGEYELVVNKNTSEKDYKRKAVWESFDGGREIKVYSSFSGPSMKLSLKWSSYDQPGPLTDCNLQNELNKLDDSNVSRTRLQTVQNRVNDKFDNSNDDGIGRSMVRAGDVEYRKMKLTNNTNSFANVTDHKGVNGKVYYQFMYNNNTQQQTESRDDFYCPWCQLNCMTIYGLMKHLKLCHPRFLFTYSQQPRGTIIIVTVNECYDGSYTGNLLNIFGQPGFAFSRRGPVRRIPVTDILVYRPQRNNTVQDQKLNLAELLEKEDTEALEAAQFSTGHRRLYFHSLTTLPIRPCEFDIDSDGEAEEPDWLFGHTKRMIDEFTDVNEGEKALMKIWNLHVMRNSSIADCQIEDQCKGFIEKNIHHLSHHGLRRNLLLHFMCLVDFGVFKTSTVLTLMDHYDKIHEQHEKNPTSSETHDLMSINFPEPDFLPRIHQLKELTEKI